MDKENPYPKTKKTSVICQSKPNTADEIGMIKKPKISLKGASIRIQNILMLHAWRREKERSKDLEDNVQKLKSHQGNLKLQIYALHHLLDGEKNRVSALYEEIHKLINSVEHSKQEKASLQKENEGLKAEVNELQSKYSALENKWRNQKNELVSAKSEAENWEKQLSKEREKLAKIKEERRALLEEINEENLDSKDGTFSKNVRDPRLKNTLRNIKKPPGRSKEEHHIEKSDFTKKKL